MPVEGHVLGLDEEVGREPVGGQQLESLLEPALVVDERADDGELVEDEAVGIERRVLDARADQGQRAAPPQLVEPGLHGRLLARALEHHVGGPLGDPLRLPGREGLEIGRVRAPRWRRGRAASCLRRSPGSTAVIGPMPRATRAAMESAPIGPAPMTITLSPAGDPRAGDPVEGHGQRLGQRRLAGGEARRAGAGATAARTST